jgi:hypothetical protein
LSAKSANFYIRGSTDALADTGVALAAALFLESASKWKRLRSKFNAEKDNAEKKDAEKDSLMNLLERACVRAVEKGLCVAVPLTNVFVCTSGNSCRNSPCLNSPCLNSPCLN